MAMLYQNRVTGGLVEVVSQHGEGILMCLDANEEVLYINEDDLSPHLDATVEQERNEVRLTEDLKKEGANPAKPTKKETFPIDTRVNINLASARQIADALPGVGLKTARDIKDLQLSLPGERFQRLEQLKSIKRIDWEEIFKENLVRVE
jgi:DNA uptake protein ComE-like DNA-binding protein|tara:strand:- start:65 stop:511 length:447 start_codon:yes stop_codon:yes gene_type:complete